MGPFLDGIEKYPGFLEESDKVFDEESTKTLRDSARDELAPPDKLSDLESVTLKPIPSEPSSTSE